MSTHEIAHRDLTAENVPAEAVLRAIVETSDDAVFTSDATGRVASWNPTAERLFCRPAADVLGEPLEDLFPEDWRHEVRSVSERVRAGEHVQHFDVEVLRKDGMPMPVSLSLCPLRGAGQATGWAVVIGRDITEQRLAQATLAEVDALRHESEAVAHVGSWLWDLRTSAVQWSDELFRIHGIDPLEFDGTFEAHIATVHPEDRDRVRAALEESVTSGQPFVDEYRIILAGKGARLLRVSAQPTVGSTGKAVGLRGVGRDITDEAGDLRVHQAP